MKHFKFLISAAAVVAFGSCLNEPKTEGPSLDARQINLICSIENGSGSRLDTDFNLEEVAFEEGDRISVDVMKRPIYQTEPVLPDYTYVKAAGGDESQYYLNNFFFVLKDGVWSLEENNSDLRLLLQEGYKYDFYAQYPNPAAGVYDPKKREYAISGSGVGLNNNDLMWASNTSSDYNETQIELNFTHLTSMIEIRQLGLGKNAEVKLVYDGDITLNALLDVGTGILTPGGGERLAVADNKLTTEVIETKTGQEAIFTAPTDGRYRLYLPPQELDYSLDPRIEICTDPLRPTDENTRIFYFEKPENPADKLAFVAGKSRKKVFAPDISDDLMYTPNSILFNRRNLGVVKTVPLGKAYAMWLYDRDLNGDKSVEEMIPELFGDLSIEMLWTDTPDFTSLFEVTIDDNKKGAAARLYVKSLTSNQIEANAVYGLSIGGKLRWSWHIWVSSVSDPAVNGGTLNGLTFMSQNLGARPSQYTGGARGLLYQWGRKDPFPGATAVKNSEVTEEDTGWDFTKYQPVYNAEGVQINGEYVAGTEPVEGQDPDPENPPVENPAFGVGVEVASVLDVTDAVLNPMVFGNDWSPNASNLWNVPFGGVAANRKSPYDPCPQGWRIAREETESPWYLAGAGSDLSDYTAQSWDKGIVFDKAEYKLGSYPQTNSRDGDTGALSTEPTSWIWHGGASGNYFLVNGQTSQVTTGGSGQMRVGAAVRCVQDNNDTQTW